jgi:1-acyl-sn-glycerol-3-phosphate acyltransferase
VTVERFTPAYRSVMAVVRPIVIGWGRLEVVGLEHLPLDGPVLIVANHDSHWDPLVIGTAARPRRQIHALAKQSLWKNPVVAAVLNGMGQIPIERGAGDVGALDTAVDRLREGACIGVFPEGTTSKGKAHRIRSGAGRLAAAVPEAAVVGVAVTGSVQLVRFPHRPRLRVEFLPPVRATDPTSARTEVSRVMDEVRAIAPVIAAGRRP